MKRSSVYIIGASGFGREIESWATLSTDFNKLYEIKGYLDDDLNVLNNYPSDFKIINKIDNFIFSDGDLAILGISKPETKEKIVFRLKGRVRFLSFVFSNTLIGKNVSLGDGVIIGPGCVITTNVTIGNFVTIIVNSIIGHDTKISDFSSIMVHVDISGNVMLGKSVFVGNNSSIAPGKKIGDRCRISTGSIVISDIPEDSLVYGNPARIVLKTK